MKKIIIIGLTTLTVGVLALILGYMVMNNKAIDQPGTKTLAQGTQMTYENISIGVSNIENDTAWLSVRDNVTNESTSKQVKARETIEVYGYQIAISSVKKTSNPSILPGSSQGYVKFVVNKK